MEKGLSGCLGWSSCLPVSGILKVFKRLIVDISYPCPSILHTTEAALWSNESSHTVPHAPPFIRTSTRPAWSNRLPARRTSIAENMSVCINLESQAEPIRESPGPLCVQSTQDRLTLRIRCEASHIRRYYADKLIQIRQWRTQENSTYRLKQAFMFAVFFLMPLEEMRLKLPVPIQRHGTDTFLQ